MNNAIERLAAELMKLPDEEWSRATERWRAGLGWDGVFGPAWDEISERLCDIDWRAIAAMRADAIDEAAIPGGKARPVVTGMKAA